MNDDHRPIRTVHWALRPRPCNLFVVGLLTGCPQGSFNPVTDDYAPSSGDTGPKSSSSSTTPTTSEQPACGDGVVDAVEVCDEGAANTQNPWESKQACADDCMGFVEYCGDGTLNGPEVCDSGDENSDSYADKEHCNTDCTASAPFCGDTICQAQEDVMQCPGDCMSTCGDGKVQAGEQCDEGMDTQTCDEDCSNSSCGDGYTNAAANEQCDDGNQIDTDACRMDCTNAACGDGVIQVGVEDCEDGNQIDDDECSDTCIAARRVFVTAAKYDPEAISGVLGADALCKMAAMKVPGLGGPGNAWLAWLSDDNSSPSTRVPVANKSFAGWYLLPDGTPVTRGWSGLTSGTLDNPINLTEAGVPGGVPPLAAWTNTKPDGTSVGASSCTNWTKSDLTQSGYGDVTSNAATWTQAGLQTCSSSLHLYCLEVSP